MMDLESRNSRHDRTMLYPTLRRLTAPRPLVREAPAVQVVAYRPPYASPAHDAFAWHADKYLHPAARLAADAPLTATLDGLRRGFLADFLVEVRAPEGRRRVAVEIGGQRSLREQLSLRRRDAAVVASGAVDAVYRLAGTDVVASVDDALFLIAAWEASAGAGTHVADVFSARGRVNLTRLASADAAAAMPHRGQASVLVRYEQGLRDGDPGYHDASLLLVRRFDRRFPAPWTAHARRAHRIIVYRPTGS
jgi:hypothetical protein